MAFNVFFLKVRQYQNDFINSFWNQLVSMAICLTIYLGLVLVHFQKYYLLGFFSNCSVIDSSIVFCLVLLQVPKCFVPVQIFWTSPKIWLHLVPLKKLLCRHKNQFYWMQMIFLSGTKCLWLAQYINQFLGCLEELLNWNSHSIRYTESKRLIYCLQKIYAAAVKQKSGA